MWQTFEIPDEEVPAFRAAVAVYSDTGDASELEALMRRLGHATDINSLQFVVDGKTYFRAPNGEWRIVS